MNIDRTMTTWIHRTLGFWRPAWIAVTEVGIWGFVCYFAGLWVGSGFELKYAVVMASTLAVSFGLAVALHFTVRRKRPDFINIGYTPRLVRYSFPSIHATVSFALATALLFVHVDLAGVSWKLIPFLIVAVGLAKVISLSRIVVGVHHWSDVVAGGFLGVGVGVVAGILMNL
jgi:undecaprenyl-diphosphatase